MGYEKPIRFVCGVAKSMCGGEQKNGEQVGVVRKPLYKSPLEVRSATSVVTLECWDVASGRGRELPLQPVKLYTTQLPLFVGW